jgi:hypothetical protein
MMDRRRRPNASVELRGNSVNYDLLDVAIANQELVSASYTGFKRDFCPHVLGRHEGRYRVIGWQFAGGSPEGSAPAWRCFELDQLRNLTTRRGKWRSGAADKAPQDCLDTIDAVVEGFDVTGWPAEMAVAEAEPEPLKPLEKLHKQAASDD